jgi:hypothetical protein
MIEKTIIAVLRKTPTLTGERFLRLRPDRECLWPEIEGYGANVFDYQGDASYIDYSRLPSDMGYFDWYGDQLGVSPYDGEVWPKDYD